MLVSVYQHAEMDEDRCHPECIHIQSTPEHDIDKGRPVEEGSLLEVSRHGHSDPAANRKSLPSDEQAWG